MSVYRLVTSSLLLFVSFQLCVVLCEVHYIIPTDGEPCSVEVCQTLSQFAENYTHNLDSNITLFIIGGNHDLDREILLSNKEQISILSINDSIEGSAVICSHNSRFSLIDSSHVHIQGIEFVGCDSNITSVDQALIINSKFLKSSHSSLTILDSHINMKSTSFTSNTNGKHRNEQSFRYLPVIPGTINYSPKSFRVGGALIVTNSTLVCDFCQFNGNTANIGGAIFSERGSNVTLRSSSFTSNHAKDCDYSLCLGGVMYAVATSDIKIHNCSFQNNTSDQYGGVTVISESTHVSYNVYNLSSRVDVSLSIHTCNYFNNRAQIGGAIYLYNSSAIINISDSTFQHNEAKLIGGTIASNASRFLVLHSSYFAFNTAKRGGVMSIHNNSTVHMEDCNLEQNTAHDSGGTVLAELSSTVVFQNSSFINNSASEGEGGVAMNLNSTVTINDSNFSSNSATSGGVLYAQLSSSITIQRSYFNKNKVARSGTVATLIEKSMMTVVEGEFIDNTAGLDGGAIKARNQSSVTIRNSIFSHNSASIFGGALHIKDRSFAFIIDSHFDSNSALDGGVINVYNFSAIKVYSSNFSNNKANVTGGVISMKLDSNSLIKESKFHNNIAFDIGGVVYTEDRTNISLEETIFANNSAIYGGAVAIRRKSTVNIYTCIGNLNTARVDGAFLYSRTNSISAFSNSSFMSNKAINNGIVVASDSSQTVIETSTFIENTVGHDGAVFFMHDRSSAVIDHCNFTSNWANNSGGVIYTRRYCNLIISGGYFYNNSAENSGGAVCIQGYSDVSIEGSTFSNNKADYGGAVRMYIRSKINITNCQFSNNEANIGGGTVASYKYSIVSVQSSEFIGNSADYGGVVIAYQFSTVNFDNVCCINNRARSGGVFKVNQRSVTSMSSSTFLYNIADESGGVLNAQHGEVLVKNSRFEQNRAKLSGGVIYTDDSSSTSILGTIFLNNTAETDGGAIGVLDSSVKILEGSNFLNNTANDFGGIVNAQNSRITMSNAVFEYSISRRSGGVLSAKNSSINISACSFTNNNASRKGGALTMYMNSHLMILNSTLMHNAANDSGGALYLAETSKSIINNSMFHYNIAEESGGAICASTKSVINITSSLFSHNTAKIGAGIKVSQNSSISFDNNSLINTQICENTAMQIGGGILLTESILYFMINTTICHNTASECGGGIHATKSDIMFQSSVVFDSNNASSGGGICLATSRLSYVKTSEQIEIIKFFKNHANIGGALFVNDSADSTMSCLGDEHKSGCFFQGVTEGLQFIFKDNFAEDSGSDLFGGLLDRCTEPNATARFQEISNIKNFSTVSSKPVRVCLCDDYTSNCSQQTHNIAVKQGNPFTIQLSAVDQVHQSVSATIQSDLKEVSLPKNQTVRRIDSQCSNLDYQVFFPSVSKIYRLDIYARGPCNGIGISNLTVNVKVLKCSCGPGFMREDISTKCVCICDKQDKIFSAYISECDSSTESIIRKGIFWITYLNNSESDDNSTSHFFIYPYCPLGYCHSPSKPVPINLNLPNGSDAQCAHNRHGLLCGGCKPDFSLSLGSSKCIRCPKNWHVLLAVIVIGALFAGALLVFLILMLNLTVAVGTVNSIIFYANIIYANKNIFFNHWQLQLSFPSVFISWLNLGIGFDVCFYDGMDAYVKIWLHLVFSLYILLLVVMVIWMSACSSRLANLLGKRNPVATLATLILLSYTKLLEAIINSNFSFVILKYPNRTTTTNWLPDANMEYTDWKLIFLICCTTIILIFGLLYTVLIFSWQWLLRCSGSKLFKWTGNQKLHLFINSYHIPHTTTHRYWTGLLLLVRVIIYLISAFSASINPRISLLSIVIIICCLLLYKTIFTIRVYKNWLLNAIETFTFFNIAVFVIFTWYTFDESSNKDKELLQTVVAYISVGVMLFLFLLVILFHMYRYGNARVYTLFHSTKLVRKVSQQVSLAHADSTPSHGSHYRLFDAIDNYRDDDDDRYSIQFVPTKTTISLTDCDESPLINETQTS